MYKRQSPDLIAYQDDLNHIAQVLQEGDQADNLDYVTQFLGGVARSAQDHDLDKAVRNLANLRTAGGNLGKSVADLSEMVQSRISAGGAI